MLNCVPTVRNWNFRENIPIGKKLTSESDLIQCCHWLSDLCLVFQQLAERLACVSSCCWKTKMKNSVFPCTGPSGPCHVAGKLQSWVGSWITTGGDDNEVFQRKRWKKKDVLNGMTCKSSVASGTKKREGKENIIEKVGLLFFLSLFQVVCIPVLFVVSASQDIVCNPINTVRSFKCGLSIVHLNLNDDCICCKKNDTFFCKLGSSIQILLTCFTCVVWWVTTSVAPFGVMAPAAAYDSHAQEPTSSY